MAFLSKNVYTATGVTDYTISWAYLDEDHVKVLLDGVATSAWTFLNPSTVRFSSAPSVGTKIVIKRETSPGTRLVDYTVGTLTEEDMDTDSLQAFYRTQEAEDAVTSAMLLSETDATVWDAQGNRITNVADPTSDQDAATKAYVDLNLGIDAVAAAAAAEAARDEALAAVQATNVTMFVKTLTGTDVSNGYVDLTGLGDMDDQDNVALVVDGVYQEPGADFTAALNGSDYRITFTGLTIVAGMRIQVWRRGGTYSTGGVTTLAAMTDVNVPSPTNGQVLTYNSTSGKWEAGGAAGTGDMTKSIYDTDDDGRVEAADQLSDGTNTLTAAQGKTAYDHSQASHADPSAITSGGVTYEALDANGDVGTGSNQVAQGNHNHDAAYAPIAHTHTGVYEPAFTKNSAFNKNFGTTSGTVCQGNDSRLSDARTPTAHTHSAADLTDEGDFYGKTRGGTISDTSGTLNVDISGQTEQVSPSSEYLLAWSGGTFYKVSISNLPTGGGGEANTGANVGTGGVGIYKTKVGTALQFKKLNAGSAKITITDDTGNDEVDIDLGSVASSDLSDGVTLLKNIVEDTTPQLGGNLDGQGNQIDDVEIKGYEVVTQSVSSSSGTLTLDLSVARDFTTTLTENVTSIVFTNVPANQLVKVTLAVTQDGSSARTVTFPGDWPDGTTPTMTTDLGGEDEYVFWTRNGGSNWKGGTIGQAFA